MAIEDGVHAITKTIRVVGMVLGIGGIASGMSTKDGLAPALGIVCLVLAWTVAWIIDKFVQ